MPYTGFDYLPDKHPNGPWKCPECGWPMVAVREYTNRAGQIIEVASCTNPICRLNQDDLIWGNISLPRGIFRSHRDGRRGIERD